MKISDCQPCPPGKYCEIGSKAFTGYCDAGYVCTGGAPSAKPQGVFDLASYVADSINTSTVTRTYSTIFNDDAANYAKSTLGSTSAWTAKVKDVNQWMRIDAGTSGILIGGIVI